MPDPNALIPDRLAPAYQAARAICRRHARSFYFASHFLPRPKRDHAYAVYAFCRLLDDAADETGSIEAVERFERELDRAYRVTPTAARSDRASNDANSVHPHSPSTAQRSACEAQLALDAFAHTVRACAIREQRFRELAEGCRMDFSITHYDTWPQLERYCYHVAGVVGLIMCDVFGLREPAARAQAVAMGNAMQLTNILRDIREDRARGRVYLPREDLDRFGVSDADLLAGRVTRPFVALMRFEIARARALYATGSAGLCHLPNDGSRFTASVMSCVYGGILDAIEAVNYDVFRVRAALSTFDKLRRVPGALRVARHEVGDVA